MARRERSLDGTWQFRIDREEHGLAQGWHGPDCDADNWLSVPVPGNWDAYLPELFGYAGHGWYRTTFRLGRKWRPSRTIGKIALRFEGANYETSVWLNGKSLGSHSGGFDPFEFDITDALDWDVDNVLAVRCDNWPRIGRVPNSMGGWWNYGGIYRGVKLLGLPPVRIGDLFVRAEPGSPEAGGAAPLSVDVTVTNDSADDVGVEVAAEVLDGERVVIGCSELACPALIVKARSSSTLTLPGASIADARLWSPGSPHLYRLSVRLRSVPENLGRSTKKAAQRSRGWEAVDKRSVDFGVRRFEVRGTEILLNGELIVLRGFNRHEEYSATGRVDFGGDLMGDLFAIKKMNGNMVRMHYQAHPDLYDLADRLGLLVFAEIPLWQVGNREIGELSDPAVRQAAENMLRTLVAELKNHPSVVIWSVGNECATNKLEARPLIDHLAGVVRSLDRSRPVAYVGMYGPDEKCFDLVDLPCVNVYFGQRMGELGPFIDKVHELAPEKPLLIAEFGHESVYALRGEGYGTEDEQAAVLDRKWTIFRERQDFVPGGLIWCLADYWHMPAPPDFRWLNRIYFCHGVMTLERYPKRATKTVRRMWRNSKTERSTS